MSIAQALVNYWEDHGKHLPSAPSIKISSRYCVEYWNNKTVADLRGRREQDAFHAWLREKGLSDASINRTVMVLKAGLNRAWSNGEIIGVPKLFSLTVTNSSPRGRPLEVEEVKKLLGNANNDYLRHFILLIIGTASRPDAILDLERSQCDLERGLINLQPSWRKPTKKRRPTVRIPEHLRSIIEGTDEGHFITYRNKPVKSLKGAWRNMRNKAGLDKAVNPYSLRHTIARHLRASGVDSWQVSQQLGHAKQGLSITEVYASADPAYLKESVDAIDEYLEQLADYV